MSEEIKDIMDALENNELKNDGFWGRACSRLSQQLQTAKEENKILTQQNKQMREALEKVKKDACCSNGDCEHCEYDEDCFGYDAQQALNKGVE